MSSSFVSRISSNSNVNLYSSHDRITEIDMSATKPNDTTNDQPLVCVSDYNERAARMLTRPVAGYYNSAAGEEVTLRDNCDAFNRIQLRPRFLRDVSVVSTACQLLGHQLSMPIAIAPWAMHRMAHPDGEVATARAAQRAGTIYTMSTLATASIEEVAASAPADTLKWFQLYIYKDRSLTESLVRRAEAAGFTAIVLTVDVPVFGVRRTDVRNRFTLPAGISLQNFNGIGNGTQDGFRSANGAAFKDDGSGVQKYANDQFDATLTWRDVQWLMAFTRLPVLLKGILTAEDAVLAADLGCAGVIVSNHGARQLDTVLASVSIRNIGGGGLYCKRMMQIRACLYITSSIKYLKLVTKCHRFVFGCFNNLRLLFMEFVLPP